MDTSWVKAAALEIGFDLVGVCEAVPPPHHAEYESWLAKGYHGTMGYLRRQAPLRSDPRHLLPSARSIVAVGLNYHQPTEHEPGELRIAQYALGRDYHKVLRRKLHRLAARLQAEQRHAQFRACVDSAPILERDYAHLAGLGWFGKSTMLINSRRGSWFFIGLLLTDLVLEPDKPALGGCGTCTRCIDACPTGAIVFEDGRWQINASRCVSYLTIEHRGPIEPDLARRVGEWSFGCDVCQEVCPFNESRPSQPLRAQPTREPDFTPRPLPSLTDLADLALDDWDRLTRGSPIRRAGYEGLRRNARINLANRELTPLPMSASAAR